MSLDYRKDLDDFYQGNTYNRRVTGRVLFIIVFPYVFTFFDTKIEMILFQRSLIFGNLLIQEQPYYVR